ncbi:hypothetical protein AURDEDRAFT_175675 [Auricularia subglabra TFB-10046 SS5]|uniref:DUF6533 domain-containing protein n=1 Tax=Auricularia subglabra (strain TFB-10046 / SS5) TaxID=717982 RepID=J0CX31_AURST|nr:hypothetical protein AURDEDRAFT_175675 [Auricularia subglabra TFB-10046 SS5]
MAAPDFHLPAFGMPGTALRAVDVASCTLFIYDHLTTFSAEVGLIWGSPWNPGKVLFLVARYPLWLEFAFLIYNEFITGFDGNNCSLNYLYTTLCLAFGITIAESTFMADRFAAHTEEAIVILILRTVAIWGNRRFILVALSAVLFAVTVISLWAVFADVKTVARSQHQKSASYPSAFELIIVIMTVIPGATHCSYCSQYTVRSYG